MSPLCALCLAMLTDKTATARWIAPLVALALITPVAFAQEAPTTVITGPDGQPVELSPEQQKAIQEAQQSARRGRRGGQPEAKSGEEAKKEGDDKSKDDDKKDEKKDADDSVKRPDKPPRVPDPRELDVALDDQGKVPPFNFIGQPWPDVMQWLANLSQSSLDWQELPDGYLNLTTQHSYTLDELRDLINRHLHARGYTAIQAGEVLSVFKIEKLDPSLVRQVSEEELYNLKRYDFAKVSFDLPSGMEVDKAKDDVKQVLSPHAKVFPLVTTRRLLVMDAVANLRTVSELLNQERMVQDGRIIPKEFILQHARPEQVIEVLYVMVGVDPDSKPVQTDPRVQQQQMEMLQRMQREGGGKNMVNLMQKDEPKVFLAYNRQRNSVLANAPPAEMKIIEQTIRYMDVPFGGEGGQDFAADSGSTKRTMKKYPLTTLDPENFVTTLEEIGGLSPYAEFKADEKSKTLFVLASEADHKKIDELVDQFDGSGRQFEVVWLRRLPADAVAATIYNLMGGQAEEKDDSDRDRYRWWDWDRRRDEDEDKPVKGFGVDADIENNRLLLWANEVEMERVRDLLIKLGEIPSGNADPRPVRFIDPTGEQSTAELVERLRDLWQAAGGNELIINTPESTNSDASASGDTSDAKPAEDRSTALPRAGAVRAHFAQLGAASAPDAPVTENEIAAARADDDDQAAPSAADASEKPPVTITVTEDGRLMLSSPDTVALDRLEELIGQLTPPEKRFKVYRLEHIPASHMYWDLTDYFAEDLEDDSSGYTRDWYGFVIPRGNQDKGGTGLSKRRKLMITYDVPSNSILVANASASQLAEIEQLIEEFDKPAPKDSVEIRQTAAIKIHYSRPSVIAAAVKEVYRDLLSLRDKEFAGGEQREQRASAERVTVINYGGSGSSSDGDRPSPLKVGFDGALSLGADDVSGVLIVSAQKGIFDDIVKMVKELDAEAAPNTTVHVHHVSGNVTAEALQKAIDEAVGKPWLGGRPDQTGTSAQAEAASDDRDRERSSRSSDRRRSRD